MTAIRFLTKSLICLALCGSAYSAYAQASTGAWDKVPLTELRAGVAEADITPRVGIKLAGYAERTGPSTGVHDPLKAVAIVFDDGQRRFAIVSFDLIHLSQAEGDELLRAINQSTGIPATHILLNASHTHGAPSLRTDEAYRREVIAKVAAAVKEAVGKLRRVSLGYGEGSIDFNISRRTLNAEGKAEFKLNPHGVVDRRVKILRLDEGDAVEPMAVIMHAVCHPNVFRHENTQISADFAGPAKSFVERSFNHKTIAMYLQGAAGNLRSNLPPVGEGFRNGSEADLAWAAYSLGAEAVQVAAGLRVREKLLERPKEFKIAAAADTLRLEPDPQKLKSGSSFRRDRIEDGKIVFVIRALAIGEFLFVGLPGEPVVEYGLGIEKDLAPLGKKVFVLGYTAGDAGYIPVEHMLDEGGYETEGPYGRGTEKAIREGVKKLVNDMLRK
ncbi:MAG: neutral/alkaline non-lysosomal ceramidase N-terminal domain-containing protein [Acidobacteria bacterium]|nr:neutral/alkaline non-lysosomal ceramidase N-terminal domain-containing protein [Acidobacteriota bacterium]